jgi:release factor glutamine methyltransferase
MSRAEERPTSHPNGSTTEPRTVQEALDEGQAALRARSGPDARREALYLLAGVVGLAPGEVVLQRDRRLDDEALTEYMARLARRARGEPLQYIEGRAAFRDLWLRVNPSVLVPRPETEQLVDKVLDWSRGREGLTAVDLGTGSGAIAVALASEGRFEAVVGVDISAQALNVARENAAEIGVQQRVDFRLGSLFSALTPGERFHVVVSNPPYIPQGDIESLPEDVREWEPAVALFAGPTGLEVIEEIIVGAPEWLESGGLLALELAPDVARAAAERVRATRGYGEPCLERDLAGRWRILLAERR